MATKHHISLDKGAAFELSISVANLAVSNLLTYNCAAQIRKHYNSSNATSFECTIEDANTVVITLSTNSSANLADGRHVYDVIITSNTGVVTRVVEGFVDVNPRVTR